MKEIGKDGRFIAYDDGTVMDTRSGLMWAKQDNGSNINWQDAKSYCENYRGGGYTDWRMPTQDELAGLYDKVKTYISTCGSSVYLTELICLTCTAPWASEAGGSSAAYFNFYNGIKLWAHQSNSSDGRALPVRSDKKGKPTAISTALEYSGGCFIANNNGTLMDTGSGLMWAERDNGSDISWFTAKSYCENYRGGGYTDWRMPTSDELAGLRAAAKTYQSGCGYKGYNYIHSTDIWVWASETRGSKSDYINFNAAYFHFHLGLQGRLPPSASRPRAVPVRSGK